MSSAFSRLDKAGKEGTSGFTGDDGGVQSLEAAGLADTQLGHELLQNPRPVLAGDSIEEQFGRFEAELIFWQLDRCQFGTKYGKPWIVIETDHSKILWAAKTHFFGRLQQTDGHKIIGDVHAVGPMREQKVTPTIAGLHP